MSFKKIGTILKPFGLEGRLLIQLESVDAEFLRSLKNVYWGHGSTAEEVSDISSLAIQSKKIILGLKQVTNRHSADQLRHATLFVPAEIVPEPKRPYPGYTQYIGYGIRDRQGHFLGKILRTESWPAQDMLIVQHGEDEKMIPLTNDFLVGIQEDRQEFIMDLPEGLLDED
ncbi:MAG: rRNA processing protein RimM [Candidatus Marinimicrobia bacterium]|jgi:16S rRNA processing protein RimM|nr:rRNA processing protein RimM [Candidatus Neomarinimicrobiota bacterium]